jgi:hypothetical protein
MLIGAATLLTVTVALAQNNPPPGNVNPGSMKSGAEQSGAENQPRSKPGTDAMGAGQPMPAMPRSGNMQESSPDSTAGGAAGTRKDNKPQ